MGKRVNINVSTIIKKRLKFKKIIPGSHIFISLSVFFYLFNLIKKGNKDKFVSSDGALRSRLENKSLHFFNAPDAVILQLA